ncbi:uncharacterized protein LOC116929090 [Daphnia magna]|uniref:Uncharacterized protein n=1 Tax=Daphnia magna TaxID=35525 RepID=A0A164W396_9CRUS|nr:uncharacterized protein LOC116929090 [Daphnia magna]KZS12911.1 Uncharacterized protein APZ42_022164 [Daphnia magna]
MAKTILLAGLLVCFIEHSFSVNEGQGQEPPVPDVRQFLYAPMSALGTGAGVAAPAVVASPPVANPCQSLDAQYPAKPCSPPQEIPNPAYLPVAAPAPFYQPQTVQTLPQAMPATPVLPPMPAVYMDYNRYPYVNNKQLYDDRIPIIPEDEVPSQYI